MPPSARSDFDQATSWASCPELRLKSHARSAPFSSARANANVASFVPAPVRCTDGCTATLRTRACWLSALSSKPVVAIISPRLSRSVQMRTEGESSPLTVRSTPLRNSVSAAVSAADAGVRRVTPHRLLISRVVDGYILPTLRLIIWGATRIRRGSTLVVPGRAIERRDLSSCRVTAATAEAGIILTDLPTFICVSVAGGRTSSTCVPLGPN